MKLTKNNIRELRHLLVYGAGGAAEDLICSYQLDINTITIASTFGGETLLSRPVEKFESIPKNKFNIIIASQYFYDIYTSIQGSDIEYENIYCFNVYTKEITLVEQLLRNKNRSKTLYAVYDLEQNPASFDACVFANAAELYRQKNNYSDIHFLIVPPILKYGRLCDANFYNNGQEQVFKERINALIIPIFSLINTTIGCSLLAHREEAINYLSQTPSNVFPDDYEISQPKDNHNPVQLLPLPAKIGFFTAPERARSFVDSFIKATTNLPIVCFTIREYLDEPDRNNDINELILFLDDISRQGFFPVIVRDTANAGEKAIKGLEKYQYFPMASLDIGIRMALYERALMNFFTNNGPVGLAAFHSKVNYMIFKLADESIRCTNAAFFKDRYGIDTSNTQYLWASHKMQKIFWIPDSFENMSKEFNNFINELKK